MDMLDLMIVDDLDDDELLAYVDLCFEEEPEHLRWKRLTMTMTMTMNLFPIYNIYNTHTYNMKIIMS